MAANYELPPGPQRARHLVVTSWLLVSRKRPCSSHPRVALLWRHGGTLAAAATRASSHPPPASPPPEGTPAKLGAPGMVAAGGLFCGPCSNLVAGVVHGGRRAMGPAAGAAVRGWGAAAGGYWRGTRGWRAAAGGFRRGAQAGFGHRGGACSGCRRSGRRRVEACRGGGPGARSPASLPRPCSSWRLGLDSPRIWLRESRAAVFSWCGCGGWWR
jgi:hypothetical protein